jgi:uncharacterized membrane protein YkoI
MASPRSKLTTAAAIGAAALGGATIANAATSNSASTPPAAAQQGQAPAQRDPATGGHTANGKTETLLSGDAAAKVKAAALAKAPGTVERVETDADHGSPYEAHVKKADGTEVEVLVDSDFKVTAVNTIGHP